MNPEARELQEEILDEFHQSLVAAYCMFENPFHHRASDPHRCIGGPLTHLPRADAAAMMARRYYFGSLGREEDVHDLLEREDGAKRVRSILRKGRLDVGLCNFKSYEMLPSGDFAALSYSLQVEPPAGVQVPKGSFCVREAVVQSLNGKGVDRYAEKNLKAAPWTNEGCVYWYSLPVSRGLKFGTANDLVWSGGKQKIYRSRDQEGWRVDSRKYTNQLALMFALAVIRPSLWTLASDAGAGGLDFGTDREYVKSILYARTLPVSASGRKRPLLHLVDSHKRRLKNGTEIDIDEHLRGVKEVTLGDSVVRIKPPQEVEDRIADRKALKA